MNADGYSDIIAEAPTYSNGEYLEGAAFLYVGPNVGAPPALTALGACGGSAGLDLAGFTPGGMVILLASTLPGPGRLASTTCLDTNVDVKNSSALPFLPTVDPDGERRVFLRGPVACGTYMQAVDVTTCAVSNVVGF